MLIAGLRTKAAPVSEFPRQPLYNKYPRLLYHVIYNYCIYQKDGTLPKVSKVVDNHAFSE